ncbi:MAG TPA: AAA family ATPase [Desulfurococcales archaeon]|nr:AAA family ATPase [Desulfurococcales archaeon]
MVINVVSNHLEELARKYALKAIEADRKGLRETAIANYKRAIEILSKIVKLYPNSPFIRVYVSKIREYQERVRYLEGQAVSYETTDLYTYGDLLDVDELIVREKPKITWNDIVDIDEAKRAIKDAIVYPIRRPDLFPLGWPRGILLFGPPGCGKTLLATAVANEIDAVFIHVDAASIMSKWLGEAEKNVAKLFRRSREIAKQGKPVIIFIDEVDALLGVHYNEVGGEIRVRNQFLQEMDGLRSKTLRLHLYVIAATNKPWKLDEAFIRRFQKRIYVKPPDFTARLQLFKYYTRGLKLSDDIDFRELARLTEGYSASDIKDICLDAQIKVVRELFEKHGGVGTPRPISMQDFLEVISKRKPSISSRLLKAYEEWFRAYGAV